MKLASSLFQSNVRHRGHAEYLILNFRSVVIRHLYATISVPYQMGAIYRVKAEMYAPIKVVEGWQRRKRRFTPVLLALTGPQVNF